MRQGDRMPTNIIDIKKYRQDQPNEVEEKLAAFQQVLDDLDITPIETIIFAAVCLEWNLAYEEEADPLQGIIVGSDEYIEQLFTVDLDNLE